MLLPQEEVFLEKGLPLARRQQHVSGAMAITPPPPQPQAAADSTNLENMTRKLEENLATQHTQTVEVALKNIRILVSMPKLISLGYLLQF